MPCHRVHQPRRRGGHHGAAPPPTPALRPALQVAHGGGGLGVEDGVHVIGAAHHPQQRQRLVRRHHQLEPRPLRADQLLAGERVPEPARPERQPVGLPGHLALEAEAGGAGATPAQRGLAPRPVVVQRLAGMIVLPAQDRRFVVGDLLDAHPPEPRHAAALPFPTRRVEITLSIRGDIGADGRRIGTRDLCRSRVDATSLESRGRRRVRTRSSVVWMSVRAGAKVGRYVGSGTIRFLAPVVRRTGGSVALVGRDALSSHQPPGAVDRNFSPILCEISRR